jgi:acyl-CoA synthetase (AMP-forming)/AMP-acid ligase II
MTPIGASYWRSSKFPDSVAFVAGDDTWSYRRLATEAEQLARALVRRGLRAGDRVALHRANLPELVIAYYACFRIGATACPFNIRLKTAELQPSCGAASYIGNDRAAEICCPRCPVQKTVAATTASPVAPS